MSIRLSCPKCRKALRVKEELAGKKISCPGCKTAVPVPAASVPVEAQAAAPDAGAAHKDGSDLALEALSEVKDAPAEEPGFVEFTCPQCDVQVKLSAADAGKQAPCPECRRIIKVPALQKAAPKDWRQAPRPAGPTPELLKNKETLDDSWSSASVSKVSAEALHRAGAVKVEKPKLTRIQWAQRITLAVTVLAVLGVGYWLVQRLLHGAAEAALLAEVEDYAGPRIAGQPAATQLAFHRLWGEYAALARQRGRALEHGRALERDPARSLQTAQQFLPRIAEPVEQYAAAGELAESLERAFPHSPTLASAQGAALALAPAGAPRWKLFRRHAQQRLAAAATQTDDERRGAEQKKAFDELLAMLAKAMPSTPGATPARPRDFTAEVGALGVLGQECLRAKRRDLAERAWKMGAAKAENLEATPLPFAVLALLLERPAPANLSPALLEPARAHALALRDQRAALLEQLGKLTAASVEEAEARLEIAELFAAGAKELAAAQLAAAARSLAPRAYPATAWLRFEACRIAARVEGAPAAEQLAQNLLKDGPGELARLRLVLLLQKLSAEAGPPPPGVADEVRPEGVAASLAAFHVARRLAETDPRAAQSWASQLTREPDPGFATLGVLMGLLGREPGR